jgi:hypothetical protein
MMIFTVSVFPEAAREGKENVWLKDRSMVESQPVQFLSAR